MNLVEINSFPTLAGNNEIQSAFKTLEIFKENMAASEKSLSAAIEKAQKNCEHINSGEFCKKCGFEFEVNDS